MDITDIVILGEEDIALNYFIEGRNTQDFRTTRDKGLIG